MDAAELILSCMQVKHAGQLSEGLQVQVLQRLELACCMAGAAEDLQRARALQLPPHKHSCSPACCARPINNSADHACSPVLLVLLLLLGKPTLCKRNADQHEEGFPVPA